MEAIELINVLRPIVAISTYIVFAAHDLQQFADEIQKLKSGNPKQLERFAQDVRHYYPFGLS